MKICMVALCLLAAPAFAQESNEAGYVSFYLRYDGREVKLSEYEEGKLLDYVYDLYLSEGVTIDIRRMGNTYSEDAIVSQRYEYFAEMCKEYNLSELTTHINIVTSRFDEEPNADVKIRYIDPIIQKKVARKEAKFTHPDGWRVHCFESDVSFIRGARVRILRTPEEFKEINLLTVDEDGSRLEVFAVVSLAFPSDTVLPSPVKFQIPLHGIEEVGCKEYTLMRNATNTFPSNVNKASVKREDGMMLWKLDANMSGTYVIARKTTDTYLMKFCAPEGYAILSARATSLSPYIDVEATISDNQLQASFSNMPDPEHVICEFTLADLQGNQYATLPLPAKTISNANILSFLRKRDAVLPEHLVAQKVVNK
jgi:hypothetical protein